MVFPNLGQRIREERLKAHVTQEQLAERVGLNNSYISQVERGIKNPSLEAVVAIANALQITVDHLLSDIVSLKKTDGLLDELVQVSQALDPDDLRYFVSITRMFVEHQAKKNCR